MKTIIKIASGFLLTLMLAGCATDQLHAVLAYLPTPSAAVGDSVHGESVFREGTGSAPPCISCHQIITGGFTFGIGPNLADIAQVATTRVTGMDAAAYIHQSIVDPGAYLVPGFRNIMYPHFAQDLSVQEIEDLVAFLMAPGGE